MSNPLDAAWSNLTALAHGLTPSIGADNVAGDTSTPPQSTGAASNFLSSGLDSGLANLTSIGKGLLPSFSPDQVKGDPIPAPAKDGIFSWFSIGRISCLAVGLILLAAGIFALVHPNPTAIIKGKL